MEGKNKSLVELNTSLMSDFKTVYLKYNFYLEFVFVCLKQIRGNVMLRRLETVAQAEIASESKRRIIISIRRNADSNFLFLLNVSKYSFVYNLLSKS